MILYIFDGIYGLGGGEKGILFDINTVIVAVTWSVTVLIRYRCMSIVLGDSVVTCIFNILYSDLSGNRRRCFPFVKSGVVVPVHVAGGCKARCKRASYC